MAYNEILADRVQRVLRTGTGLEAKKMFGGIGLLLNGHMACGILNDDLIVRVGPERYRECLALPHAREFDLTGRAMKGWVMVAEGGTTTERDLAEWVERGLAFARTLPPK